jgi:hypothetical protein
MTREAKALVHLYLEAQPDETEKEALERLEKFIYFIQDVYPGLSLQVHELEMQEI